MPQRTAKQIYNKILGSNKILLVPHQNPDGDAIGSVSAMMQFLDFINKPYLSFCATEISPKLQFLPHTKKISNNPKIWDNNEIDLILILDSSDLDYAGVKNFIEAKKNLPTIINIDHHKSNEQFGDLNFVLENTPSTTYILYHFFKYNEIKIDAVIADSLLTGLLYDTGNFTNSATTASALKVSGDLIAKGANLQKINEFTLKDKTIPGLKLWGAVFQRFDKHEQLDIVYTYVMQKDLKTHGVTENEIEGFSNFLNNLEDGKAKMILKEQEDGSIRGSLRTTRDDVDVSIFANAFGGGGHQKAAGFSVDGPMDVAINKVFEKIESIDK